jgi:hypothetical protein
MFQQTTSTHQQLHITMTIKKKRDINTLFAKLLLILVEMHLNFNLVINVYHISNVNVKSMNFNQ